MIGAVFAWTYPEWLMTAAQDEAATNIASELGRAGELGPAGEHSEPVGARGPLGDAGEPSEPSPTGS